MATITPSTNSFWFTKFFDAIVPNYTAESYFPTRAISLFWEGLKKNPSVPSHVPDTKTWSGRIEKLGDIFLKPKDLAPHILNGLITNPQVIAALAFVTLNLGWSYTCYPEKTTLLLAAACAYLPAITSDRIRFVVWLVGSEMISGYSMRFGGRLTDSYLAQLSEKNKRIH